MRFLTRIIAMSRAVRLGRQFRDIERGIGELSVPARKQLALLAMKEFACAAKSEFPHLYGTPPDQRYLPWGAGTDIGFERARSENLQVRLRGAAMWLAVAYHETKDTPYADLQALHRQLLRVLRTLKESAAGSSDAAMAEWAAREAAA
ncbi:MAG: hypothetical protein ABFC67_09945 [Mizugakiibacter sp.]|uniref:hypothetical protein n=1 Tax=Mizugakiibacter sp. TaxID=1972610 RepID=UPI0031BC50C1|nr:hypothetical protein [Xanthomonadaceae bacterium]